MRVALLDRPSRADNNLTANVPAPIGGWNTRDALAEMSPVDAPVLDNWFPRAGQVVQRGGSLTWATGMTGTAQSIFQYAPATGGTKLFASTNAGIYDVTAGGAVGAVVKALTNGYLNTIQFANSAGTNYLWCCNGSEVPFYFDGAAWTSTAITGIASPLKLIYPAVFKHRIFAIESGSMNVWYLPIDSIQGAANVLPFGNIMKLGGRIQSIGSWTLDAGEGPDDLFVAVSSEGQLAVYKGTDPASASSWAIVGVWYVGKPLFRKCFVQAGGDVIILTENGAFPLSKLLQSGRVNFGSALSNKIQPSWTNTVKSVGVVVTGWEVQVFPQFDALVVNVPTANGNPAIQYVMNTITGAWCSFSGWDATAFTVYNSVLYYTSSTTVVKAWDGVLVSDNGNDVVTTVHTAYNYFGSKTKLKKVSLFRTLISFNASVQFSWAISPDFQTVTLSSIVPRGATLAGSLWDTVLWDTHFWDSVLNISKSWRASSHIPGYALSLWLQTATNSSTLAWAGTDYILQGGAAM